MTNAVFGNAMATMTVAIRGSKNATVTIENNDFSTSRQLDNYVYKWTIMYIKRRVLGDVHENK